MQKVTLEQWQTLVAIIDQGSYAAAAEAMDKSQSTLSYAISKLETQLGIKVFTLQGRKAVLTSAGNALYQRAKNLVEEAHLIEELAAAYRDNKPSHLSITVDALFPKGVLYKAIQTFKQHQPQTRIDLYETVLSGTYEAILQRKTDIILSNHLPTGIRGTHLLPIQLLAVAHKDHLLHQLASPISDHQLSQYCQIITRDSGSENINAGWLQAHNHITVDQMKTTIDLVKKGLGFAWLPQHDIQTDLDIGLLKPLSLHDNSCFTVSFSLIETNIKYKQPIIQQFNEILLDICLSK